MAQKGLIGYHESTGTTLDSEEPMQRIAALGRGWSRLAVVSVMALTAACNDHSATAVQNFGQASPARYDLVLTIDSETEYTAPGICGGLYCFQTVQSSGTILGLLVLGQTHPGAPIVSYDSVVFSGSLHGTAALESTGLFDVDVQLPFSEASGCCPYDFMQMTGVLDSVSFRGSWTQELDPHGLRRMGHFTGVRQ
jgi:hypothetical protein